MHVRHRPHRSKILNGLVRCSVRTNAQAAMRRDYLYVKFGIRDRVAYLIETFARDEGRVGTYERYFPGEREPCSYPEHVRLSYTDVEEPIRIAISEQACLNRDRGIGTESYYPW